MPPLCPPHQLAQGSLPFPQLFLGDTNRVVAETPLNQASSRSHCVFTLHLEARRAGEPLVRRSKLHFVDLAGSERAGKTGLAAHAQLKEAKYINLSLHFLEQVGRRAGRSKERRSTPAARSCRLPPFPMPLVTCQCACSLWHASSWCFPAIVPSFVHITSPDQRHLQTAI